MSSIPVANSLDGLISTVWGMKINSSNVLISNARKIQILGLPWRKKIRPMSVKNARLVKTASALACLRKWAFFVDCTSTGTGGATLLRQHCHRCRKGLLSTLSGRAAGGDVGLRLSTKDEKRRAAPPCQMMESCACCCLLVLFCWLWKPWQSLEQSFLRQESVCSYFSDLACMWSTPQQLFGKKTASKVQFFRDKDTIWDAPLTKENTLFIRITNCDSRGQLIFHPSIPICQCDWWKKYKAKWMLATVSLLSHLLMHPVKMIYWSWLHSNSQQKSTNNQLSKVQCFAKLRKNQDRPIIRCNQE